MSRLHRIFSVILILLLMCFLLINAKDLFSRVNFNLGLFLSTKGDYEQLRFRSIPYQAISEAKRLIPPQQSVFIKISSHHFYQIMARYFAYPLKLNPDAPFYVDITKQHPPSWSDYQIHWLSSGIPLYVKSGFHLMKPQEKQSISSLLKIILFVTLTFNLVMIGMFYLRMTPLSQKLIGRVGFLSSSYLIGFILSAGSLLLFLILGGKLVLTSVLLIQGGLTLALAMTCRWRMKRGVSPVKKVEPTIMTSHCTIGVRLINFLGLIILGLYGLVTISIPISVWDEMLIWVMKARVLFFEQKFVLLPTDYSNNYYPLLWPVHISSYLTFLSGDYDEVAKWATAVALFSLMGQLYTCLRFLLVASLPYWGLVGMFFLGVYQWILLTALPENIFMAFLAGMISWIILWLRHPQNPWFLILGVLMSVGLSLVKFEGCVFSLMVAGCLGILMFSKKNNDLKSYWRQMIFFSLGGALMFGWISWVKTQGYQLNLYHLQIDVRTVFSNLRLAIEIVLAQIKDPKNLLGVLMLAGWVFYFTFVAKKRLDRISQFLLWLTIAFGMFSVVSVVGWSKEDIRLYYPEVLSRLSLRTAIPLFLLICYLWLQPSQKNQMDESV